MENKYSILTSIGPVIISFEENKFRIEGPKEILSKVVAGLGGEDDTRAWVTESELKTEEMRIYAVVEIIKRASEMPSNGKAQTIIHHAK